MAPHTQTVIPDSEGEEEEGSDVGGEQPSPVQRETRQKQQPRQGLRRRLDLQEQPQQSDSVVLDEDTTQRRAAARAAKGKQPAARQASSVKREADGAASSEDDAVQQQQPVTAQDIAALQAELESNPRLARQLASGEGPSSRSHQWRVRVYYVAMQQRQQAQQARQQQAAGSKRRRADPATAAAAAAAAAGGGDSSAGGGRQPSRAAAAAAAAAAADDGDGAAAATSTHDRRRLRQKLRGLEAEASHQAEALRDASSGKLLRMLTDVGELDGMATAPREQAQTAGMLAVLTGNGLAMMQRFANSAQGRHPTDLVNALRQAYGHSQLTGGVDFTQVGSDASHLFRRAPGLGNMLGPLAAAPKVRAAPQRRARQAPAAEVAPVEGPAALQQQHGQAQETDHVVQDMRTVLSEVGSCRVVHLVLDHDSFAATMENTFALSFLVKDMWVRLEAHARDGLLAHHLDKRERAQLDAAALQRGGGGAAAAAGPAAASAGRQHAFMMTWTMAMWRELCGVVRRSETLMPPRRA